MIIYNLAYVDVDGIVHLCFENFGFAMCELHLPLRVKYMRCNVHPDWFPTCTTCVVNETRRVIRYEEDIVP